jgi:flagellar basal-body rod protein FlgG
MTSILTAMNIATTGMKVSEFDISVKAHNMSNLNTVGYKKDRTVTSDLFYMNIKRQGIPEVQDLGPRPIGLQLGTGAKVVGTHRILEQGIPLITNNPLDVAIQGMGYFSINIGNGRIGYTRNGQFHIDSNRAIVTSEGHVVVGPGVVPLGIPADYIQITEEGIITATDPLTNTTTNIGQLNLFTFANEEGMLEEGGNVLIQTDASGPPIEVLPGTNGSGTLMQRALESSNVNTVEELTSLISAQRAYELCAKIIKVGDEMLQAVNNLK